MSKRDIATLADIERRVVAMLRQIDAHEGRETLLQAAEKLLNSSARAIWQAGGLKRLNDVLDDLDQAICLDHPRGLMPQ
jgi:hypothetical protein